jgi:hypothetical protein
MVMPIDPSAPALLLVVATGPGPTTRGFSGPHLLALFFVETGAIPKGFALPWQARAVLVDGARWCRGSPRGDAR